MEGLGWWIYLCSVAGGILTVSLIFSIVFLAAFLITSGATTGNITHKVATIKGLCRRCIDFINEYGLE